MRIYTGDDTCKYILCIFKMHSILSLCIIILIIYHDFLPTPRRGSHVKSDITHTHTHTHTVIKIHPLAHILDT